MDRLELAARLVDARQIAGLTQEELAEKAKVSPSTVSGLESAKVGRPQFRTLHKLGATLGLDVSDIYGESIIPKAPAPTWPQPAVERRRAEAFLRAYPDEGARVVLLEEVARAHQRWADSWYMQAERLEEEGIAPHGRALEADTMHSRLMEGPRVSGLSAYVSQVRKGERAVSERESAACKKSDEEAGRLGHAMMYMRGVNAEALEEAEAEAKTLDSLREESPASVK